MNKRILALCAVLSLTFASVATAQLAPGQTTGRDVVVADIPNQSNRSPVGGVDAVNIGTTSCNIGTANLAWTSGNNQHPVIAQHFYRWDGIRMEQIGQSWLKHGFSTVNNNLCGPCGPGLGSQLPPGCSDPYGSGLNSSQGNLGPKSEVNAWTGNFSYPFGDQGMTGNSIYKRGQFPLSEVGGSGWRYVAEAHYVSPDDALDGNQNNNASWREMNISGNSSDYSLTLTGPTIQLEPAIMAWQDFDGDVSINVVDVPGEGRFHVALLIIDNGNGTYTYEFAVHNMNSHRSAQSFTVDFPNGAAISNIGFHDVDYHSGEPYSGTDWSSSVGSSSITWSTQTFAQNPNANAIRWGTTYNFRFTSNMAPGNIIDCEIGLFRPGSPSSVNTSFTPPATLALVSGDNQQLRPGDAITPLEVSFADLMGVGIPGVQVNFTEAQGRIAFANGGVATTDANGIATMTGTVNANAIGGPVEIIATAGDSSVTFNASIVSMSTNWIQSVGLLVYNVNIGWANAPFIIILDVPGIAPLATPWGNIDTSFFNGTPSYYGEAGYDADPTLIYNPGLVTGSTGQKTQVYPGLGFLVGSTFTTQVYALRFTTQLEVIILNSETINF